EPAAASRSYVTRRGSVEPQLGPRARHRVFWKNSVSSCAASLAARGTPFSQQDCVLRTDGGAAGLEIGETGYWRLDSWRKRLISNLQSPYLFSTASPSAGRRSSSACACSRRCR